MKASLVTLFLLLFVPVLLPGQQNKLTVSVDEKIELLTTVQLLSGYNWLTKADLQYKKDVQSAFTRFKDHKAVSFYKSISDRLYGYDPLLLLCHYQLPGFKQAGIFTDEDKKILRFSDHKDTLDSFICLLKDFHEVTHFNKFFIAHKSYYDSVSASIVKEAQRIDYAGILEKHFGQKNAAYRIVLSPLQMDAGFGPMIQTKHGNVLYAIVGPNFDSGAFPVFDRDVLFKELVIHEFCHSFCNPLIDSFYEQLKQDSCLLKPIITQQKEQGYGSWKTCLYEHLTRANEIVLNGIIYDKETAEQLYKKQVNEDKWIYLEGLVPLLRNEYLGNRVMYKTQRPLMPKIIAYFDKERKECP